MWVSDLYVCVPVSTHTCARYYKRAHVLDATLALVIHNDMQFKSMSKIRKLKNLLELSKREDCRKSARTHTHTHG